MTPYRIWIRETQRCIICGQDWPDPHHLKAIGMGGTSDHDAADIKNVIPLCRAHHIEYHHQGRKTWAQNHGLTPEELQSRADKIWDKYAKEEGFPVS